MYHQDWCFLAVQGPEVEERDGRDSSRRRRSSPSCSCYETEYHRRPVIVTRSGYTGEVGFELFTYQDIAEELWGELLGSVRTFGGGPCGLAARDVLRLEMGYPLYGQDLFEASTAFEAGLAVGRRHGQGRVPRARGAAPPAGRRAARAVCGGSGCTSAGTSPAPITRCSSGDQLVGEVTSGTFSPVLGTGIALAYVWPGDVVELGQEVEVDIRGRRGSGDGGASRRSSSGALGSRAVGGRASGRLRRPRDRHEVADPVVAEARAADQLLQEVAGRRARRGRRRPPRRGRCSGCPSRARDRIPVRRRSRRNASRERPACTPRLPRP